MILPFRIIIGPRLVTKETAEFYIMSLKGPMYDKTHITLLFRDIEKITPTFAYTLFSYVLNNFQNYEIKGLNTVQQTIVDMEIKKINDEFNIQSKEIATGERKIITHFRTNAECFKLFEDMNNIITNIASLKSIVQNDMIITNEDIDEWSNEISDVQHNLEMMKSKLLRVLTIVPDDKLEETQFIIDEEGRRRASQRPINFDNLGC